MKNLMTFVVCLLASLLAQAQDGIDANVSYATFQSQGNGFIEIYLNVLGQSTGQTPVTDSTKQAIVDVVILFKQGENVIKFDKYRLKGPAAKTQVDFVDVKRYALPNGDYKLNVSVEDVVSPGSSSQFEAVFNMDYSAEQLSISDFELIASVKKLDANVSATSPMVKGNMMFEPLPTNFYTKNDELMLFYFEVYNTDKAIGDDYLMTLFIDNADTKDREEKMSLLNKRKKPESVTAAVQQVDIKDLPTGNYNLVAEIRDKNRELLAKKAIPFQRSNPYLKVSETDITTGKYALEDEFVGKLTTDELVYALKAIFMQVDKADGEHIKLITTQRNENAMRLYLFSYWIKENHNNPQAAYEAYMNVARQVDVSFANGFGRGFETDRGYIFLKYGAPNNTVFEENDPSAPPYEIWFYNQFPKTNQNNVKFIFYNPSLTTNGHVLLHSTARGETNNPRWEVELYRNAPNDIQGGNFIDGTQMQSNIGRHARQLFDSF